MTTKTIFRTSKSNASNDYEQVAEEIKKDDLNLKIQWYNNGFKSEKKFFEFEFFFDTFEFFRIIFMIKKRMIDWLIINWFFMMIDSHC